MGKRQREEAEEAAVAELLEEHAPSDAEAAVMLLMQRDGQRQPTPAPVTFAHHLYGVLEDRSSLDLELHEAVRARRLRLFQVSSGPAERAVVEEEALRRAARALADSSEKDARATDARVVRAFADRVLGNCMDTSISSRDLAQRLAGDKDGAASVLSRLGLLVQRVDVLHADSYWFAMPGLGAAVGALKEARRCLVATIKRRRNSEILQRDLLGLVAAQMSKAHKRRKAKPGVLSGAVAANSKRRATTTSGVDELCRVTAHMGIEFHVMDAVHSGTLRAIPTGLGPLLKLG